VQEVSEGFAIRRRRAAPAVDELERLAGADQSASKATDNEA